MKTDLLKGFRDYSEEEAKKRAEVKKVLVGQQKQKKKK